MLFFASSGRGYYLDEYSLVLTLLVLILIVLMFQQNGKGDVLVRILHQTLLIKHTLSVVEDVHGSPSLQYNTGTPCPSKPQADSSQPLKCGRGHPQKSEPPADSQISTSNTAYTVVCLLKPQACHSSLQIIFLSIGHPEGLREPMMIIINQLVKCQNLVFQVSL